MVFFVNGALSAAMAARVATTAAASVVMRRRGRLFDGKPVVLAEPVNRGRVEMLPAAKTVYYRIIFTTGEECDVTEPYLPDWIRPEMIRELKVMHDIAKIHRSGRIE